MVNDDLREDEHENNMVAAAASSLLLRHTHVATMECGIQQPEEKHTHTRTQSPPQNEKEENLFRALACVCRAVLKSFYLTNTHGVERREKDRWRRREECIYYFVIYLFFRVSVLLRSQYLDSTGAHTHTDEPRRDDDDLVQRSSFVYPILWNANCQMRNVVILIIRVQ